MTTETTKARPFTDADWEGYAGAERWPDGAPPVAREVGDLYVVADRRGAEFADLDGDVTREEVGGGVTRVSFAPGTIYRLNLAFPTQAAAAAFLDGLPETFDPAAYGFIEV